MLETFQAVIGGKFAPLTAMSNKDTDINSMFITFNTALTETARKILGKHRQKKQPWDTAEIVDLQQDLADRRMANLMDPVLSHHKAQERQPAAVPELPNSQPHQTPKQSHA